MYKSIKIENLEQIKKETLLIYPTSYLDKNTLFYIENNIKTFSSISCLNLALNNLDLLKYVVGYGFHIMQPMTTGPIHVDTGNFYYSLNIPLSGCDETKVCFYKSTSSPEFKSLDDTSKIKVGFYKFNELDCNLLKSFYFNKPYIMSVKEPHNVVNDTELVRISLLIRLGNGYNF